MPDNQSLVISTVTFRKAYFFLNPNAKSSAKEAYDFNSTKNSPPTDELKEFGDRLLNIIQNIKFKTVNDKFLNDLKKDIKAIRNDSKVLFSADKPTICTRWSPSWAREIQQLLQRNITKSYKKCPESTMRKIQKENKRIATNLEIDDRVDSEERGVGHTLRPQAELCNEPNLQTDKSYKLGNRKYQQTNTWPN